MEINYVITKSPKRKSISIHISKDLKVMVDAPSAVSVKTVEEFIISKKQWIIKQIEKISRENLLAEEMGPITQEELKEIKKQAKKIIPQRVAFYAQKSGITYNRIFIRLQKSRWGSCSSDGNLNFNCLLVLMPVEILDSVVVHELCHRHHMNHSKAFYEEVTSIYPDYKRCTKWLKQNGNAYFKRIQEVKDES